MMQGSGHENRVLGSGRCPLVAASNRQPDEFPIWRSEAAATNTAHLLETVVSRQATSFPLRVKFVGDRLRDMAERRKKPIWVWGLGLLLALPVVYVASSGPLRTIAFRKYSGTFTASTGSGTITIRDVIEYGPWWPVVYRPLVRASEQSWGAPLQWYWELFPVPETRR